MSAYDITEFLRTAYQPFAYCVPSKKTWILRTKRGGCHPHAFLRAEEASMHFFVMKRRSCISSCWRGQHVFVCVCVHNLFHIDHDIDIPMSEYPIYSLKHFMFSISRLKSGLHILVLKHFRNAYHVALFYYHCDQLSILLLSVV